MQLAARNSSTTFASQRSPLARCNAARMGLASTKRGGRQCVMITSAAAVTDSLVVTATSEEEFDKIIAEAPADKVVVVDCSTTWCGPCKIFAPVFAQFAEAHQQNAIFVSVVGDSNDSTKSLMKRLQIKSVPFFLIYKAGEQKTSWAGANKTGFRNNLAQFIPM